MGTPSSILRQESISLNEIYLDENNMQLAPFLLKLKFESNSIKNKKLLVTI